MARVFEGRLPVHYGQAYVQPYDSPGNGLKDSFCGQSNGLCGAASSGALFLITGLHTGDVGFTLDVLDAPPPIDRTWEEIVEVPFTAGTGKIALFTWYGDSICGVPLSPGTYRVRYCARNMWLGVEVDTYIEGEPVDFYSLAFWPATLAPDIVVKQTSEVAAYWHNYAKSIKL
jgi:hypothetical protein